MPTLSVGNDKRNWPRFGIVEIDKACRDCKLIWKQDWLALRNAALISTVASFGKRAGEVTGLRIRDLRIEGDLLYVTFKVEKTRRDNSLSTKTRRLGYPLTKHIVRWYKYATENAPSSESYLLPPSLGRFGQGDVPDWTRPIDRRVAWNVVKRVAPDWWTHLFRHMLASRLAESGKGILELMDWFDWERPNTAAEYAKLAGTKMSREIGRGKI